MAQIDLLIDMDTRVPQDDHSLPMIRWRQASFRRKRHGSDAMEYLWLAVPFIFATLFSIMVASLDPYGNPTGALIAWLPISAVLLILTLPVMIIHGQIIQPHTNAWFGERDKEGKPTGSKKVIPQYAHAYMAPADGVIKLFIQTALKEDDLNNFSGETISVDADEVRSFVVGTYNQWFEFQDGRSGDIPVIVMETTRGQVLPVAEHWGSQSEIADLHYKLSSFVLGNRPKGGYRTFFNAVPGSGGGDSSSDDDVI